MTLALASYSAAAIAFALVTILAVRHRRAGGSTTAIGIASAVTMVWAIALALSAMRRDMPVWELATLNAGRYAAWFVALSAFPEVQLPRFVRIATYVCCCVSLFTALGAASLNNLLGLIISLGGLLFVEQLIRNAAPIRRRVASFAVVGIGGQFAYDLFLSSQSQLLGSVSESAWAARGLVFTLLSPALALTIRRLDVSSPLLFISRHVVFYTSSFVAVGVYLCLMALGGYYVRLHGGTWGSVFQILFLCGAAIVLASLLLIESPLRRLRVFIATHFYRNKYDYRVEWLRFVQTLSSSGDGDPYRSAIHAVAQILKSDGGWLLLRSENRSTFDAVASWPEDVGSLNERVHLASDSELLQFIEKKKWVVYLREYAQEPSLYSNVELPDWLPQQGPLQIVVPLLAGSD